MVKTVVIALVSLVLAANVGSAFAAGGSHVMWTYPFKGAPYGVWHDNATCPNPPAR